MGVLIVAIIAGGVVLTTVSAGLFDYLGKRHRGGDPLLEKRVASLEQKLADYEQSSVERDETVRRLQGEVSFMTRLLEGRNK